MNLLLDTNVILEVLLDQEQSESVQKLLEQSTIHQYYLTDFALHSVGVILFQEDRPNSYEQFIDDLIESQVVRIVKLPTDKSEKLSEYSIEYALDFDDAYQFAVAKEMDLTIVSFDSDFDRTPKVTKTPMEIL